MKIRVRILIAIGVTLTCTTIVGYLTSAGPMIQSFHKLENQKAEEDVLRVDKAVDQVVDQLHVKSIDWANWDDSYQFMKDHNPVFVKSNLGSQTCVDLQVDSITFFDLNGSIVHSTTSPSSGKTAVTGSSIRTELGMEQYFKQASSLVNGRAGIEVINGIPVMLSIRPIRDTNQKLAPRGWVVFASKIDGQAEARLRKVTDQDIRLMSLSAALTESKGASSTKDFDSKDVLLSPTSNSLIRGYLLVRDMHHRPAFVVRANLDRHITAQGKSVVGAIAYEQVGIGVLLALVIMIVIERTALARLAKLESQVERVTDFSIENCVEVSGKDELSQLGRRINEMLAKLRLGSVKLMQSEERLTHYTENLEQIVLERTKQIEHQAFHDALTGLPNRALFMDRLAQALEKVQRSHKGTAALFIDLDGFKLVNDSFGHDMGDQMLSTIAEILNGAVRPGDTVSRLGGDEFAILLEDLENVTEAEAVCEAIMANLRRPMTLGSHESFAGASIGVAYVSNESEMNGETLIKRADLAMYRVKTGGKGSYAIYDESMQNNAIERIELETYLRKALLKNEISVHYQPLIDLQTDRRIGAEALARWIHPTRGFIPPSQFIPIAEDTGLIITIGYWVLEEACRQTKQWIEEFDLPDFKISVNMSGKQLQRDDVVDRVRTILEKTGLEAKNLKIEITESILMDDRDTVAKKLIRLKDMGIHLALDDFGTGYSSLATLRAFPIDTLKIDRAFICRLGESEDALPIVEAILGLAKTMHMDVTGEGVENPQQADIIRELGCQIGQGYLYDKPLTAENFEEGLIRKVPRSKAA